MLGVQFKNFYVGDEAQSKRGILELIYPKEKGIIKNWNYMEDIWHHNYYSELRMSPENQHVLICDSLNLPHIQREKTCEIFMEKFNVPSMYTQNQNVLSLYASGRNTGKPFYSIFFFFFFLILFI